MNWPLLLVVSLFLLGLALFVGWPILIEQLLARPDAESLQTKKFAVSPGLADQVRERLMNATAGLWFFVFGSTIGSFLNVVAYRMPMGLTFVAKPSRCPFCETPIKFKHNVPILGWLVLRGRCNACRLPISPRYVLVEVIVGLLFFTLFCSELASGGANLPIRVPNRRVGVMWNLFTPQWDLISAYFFHAFLLGVLSTIALIKFDRLKIPIRLVLFTLTVGLGCQMIWPHLSIVPSIPNSFRDNQSYPWSNAVDPCVGFVVGFLAGASIQGITTARSGSIAILSIVGLFLGWQAVVPTIVIAGMMQMVITSLGNVLRRSSTDRCWASSFLLATWCVLCFWRQLPLIWLPGAESSIPSHVAWLFFGLAIAVVVENFSSSRDE